MKRPRRTLHLEECQRRQLEQMRDRDPIPYRRERAAALLLIAQGQSPHRVARRGLLKVRQPDTVYEWLDRYEAQGVDGLHQQARVSTRGFSP